MLKNTVLDRYKVYYTAVSRLDDGAEVFQPEFQNTWSTDWVYPESTY